MKAYAEMTREELTAELAQLKETYKSSGHEQRKAQC